MAAARKTEGLGEGCFGSRGAQRKHGTGSVHFYKVMSVYSGKIPFVVVLPFADETGKWSRETMCVKWSLTFLFLKQRLATFFGVLWVKIP